MVKNPVSLIRLQETKLGDVLATKAHAFLPHRLTHRFEFRPNSRASSELITAWDDHAMALVLTHSGLGLLSIVLVCRASGSVYTITNVYGPCVVPKRFP